MTGAADIPATWSWQRWFLPAAITTLLLDLASKQLLFASFPVGSQPYPLIALAVNPGVAWSLFARHPGFVLALTLILLPVLGWLWWRQYRSEGRCANLAFGLILGGALGNAVDRIAAFAGLIGGVRDFIYIDLGIRFFDPFPTFNLADSGITIGFILLVAGPLLAARPKPKG